MKKICFGLLVLVAAGLAGCNQGIPGGPGTSDTAKKPAYGQANDTFNLGVPLMTTSLKQGERKVTSITIKRGKDFDEDVTLKFGDMPAGVKFEPATPVIKHGDEEAKLTIIARDDAALGDFTVNVTGHPSKGADALIAFKIAVEKK